MIFNVLIISQMEIEEKRLTVGSLTVELQASRCLHLQIRSHLYFLAHLRIDVVHPFLAIAQTPAATPRQLVVRSPACLPLPAVAHMLLHFFNQLSQFYEPSLQVMSLLDMKTDSFR